MSKLYRVVLAVTLMVTASCDYIANYNKPTLDLSGRNPYELNITNFTWGYGMTEIGKFNGDFDRLDKKVYNLLKDKSGTCKVYLEQKDKDKYGKSNSTMEYIGDLNLDELNKFDDWVYWEKDSGIKTLLYQKYFKPQTEAPKTDTVQLTTQ